MITGTSSQYVFVNIPTTGGHGFNAGIVLRDHSDLRDAEGFATIMKSAASCPRDFDALPSITAFWQTEPRNRGTEKDTPVTPLWCPTAARCLGLPA